MGAVYFYHLTHAPLEATLPVLLARSRGAGWRVLVRGTDSERLNWLDQRLWLGPEDDFTPHGLAGGDHDADQPVLLTLGDENANAADCLMSVDGADMTSGEVAEMARSCILFDGNDSNSLQTARRQWKDLTDAGCHAQYWAQENGKWLQKAEQNQP